MIRLLNQNETDLTRLEWPRIYLDPSPIPSDGLIKFIDGVGCVFAFQKTDLTRLLILVDDIWPDCTRQELPAPQGFWEMVIEELTKFIPSGLTIGIFLFLTLGIISLLLLRREGFLN